MDFIRIDLPKRKGKRVLALGAQSKSSFCFTKDGRAYLSEAGGDLGDLENLRSFERRVAQARKDLRLNPEIIGCDLHPGYTATRYASDIQVLKGAEGARIKAVQHHEAHVASCMAENNIKQSVIGVAFDGTGLGTDGNIWGGEFFTGNIKGFKRRAHLGYIPMPGGEASVREPRHMAFSYLYDIYGLGLKDLKIEFLKRLDKDTKHLLMQIIDKGINSLLTSSIGRLFDAVSAISGICGTAGYEGQAAIELERAMGPRASGGGRHARYRFRYLDRNGVILIDWKEVVKEVINDLRSGRASSEISIRFHSGVCHMVRDVCVLLRKKYNVYRVCLSGGVFQNRYLKEHIRPLLEKEGFKVYFHRKTPSHDGNIALGQAVIASLRG